MNFSLRTSSKLGVVAIAVAAACFTGCEWTGGGGVDQYNGRYNFVNFGGVYRGIGGGLLITDYTDSAGSSVGDSASGGVNGEVVATGNGSSTAFAGTLKKHPLVAGSVTIAAPPAYTFKDVNGTLVAVSPSGSSAFGSINYQTGAWTLDFRGAALDSGAKIVATYQFSESASSNTAGNGTGTSSSASGVSGAKIHSFTIEQYGNVLRIVDNNGKLYEGQLGDIRSAGGVGQTSTNVTVLAGDEFIANFNASGVSAANKKVKMVGTFNARVQSASGVTFVLDDRTMQGTWIEEGGRTGDINGSTAAITLNQP